MSTTSLTLLAPARDLEVGKAAVDAGADAVYIGAPAFGARQAASNSIQDIQQLVEYAHPFGVKVLVTLNTLLQEDEYVQAVAIAHQLYAIGVDALIIQDLKLLSYALPPIRLHASTQCDNRTATHIQRLAQMGFKRVVLARELSLEEIRAIHTQTTDSNIELEAFVHGALCVCYSGRCYMSEVLMGRSANRGCCAQMCRMAYDLLDKDGNELMDDQGNNIHQRYLLSLQDMDRSLYLRQLIEAGVTTFKIEGRLKDKEYVTNIVSYYRRLLDDIIHEGQYTSASLPYIGDNPVAELCRPDKTFHRGATNYFLFGRTPSMANWQTPKSTGEYIGTILRVQRKQIQVQLLPHVILHNGDGLCVGPFGFAVNGINGNYIEANKDLSEIASFHDKRLFRNMDSAFVKSLHVQRYIPVDIWFRETTDGFYLRIGNREATFIYPHEPATNPQKAMQTIHTQLSKLGGTLYRVNHIHIETQPYFIPISQLNEWRRSLTQ